MIKAINSFLEKLALREDIISKKILQAQMVKDGINGPVLKKLSEEIAQLNLQLYRHASKQQRA